MVEETKNQIHKAVNLIRENPGDCHTLKSLSEAACFSPYHFHRIFTIATGESPGRYLRRERIKRSLNRLIHEKGVSVTEIALDSGFSSSANFSKAFKTVMGMNPRQCRKYSYTELIRIAGTNREIVEDFSDPAYLDRLKDVRITEKHPEEMLYLRYTGPYNWKIGLSWGRFISIMKKNRLFTQETVLWGIPRDNPDLSMPETCIYDIGATGIHSDSSIAPLSIHTISGGRYAVFPFCGTIDQLNLFFAYIYGYWFTTVSAFPGDKPVLQRVIAPPRNKVLAFDIFIPLA